MPSDQQYDLKDFNNTIRPISYHVLMRVHADACDDVEMFSIFGADDVTVEWLVFKHNTEYGLVFYYTYAVSNPDPMNLTACPYLSMNGSPGLEYLLQFIAQDIGNDDYDDDDGDV